LTISANNSLIRHRVPERIAVVSAEQRGEALGPGLGGGGGGKQRRGVRDSGPGRGTLDAPAARTPAVMHHKQNLREHSESC
jgi:hypothetical protein